MSGGGNLISTLLDPFGIFTPTESFEAPEVEVGAPPAPSRKQDTGAMVRTGTEALERTQNQRTSGGTSRKTGISALGRLGRGSGLGGF